MNGGYAMVDFTGCDLGTVAGIYERTKAAIEGDKPIVIYGMVN